MSIIEYFPVAMAVAALALRFWLGPELIDAGPDSSERELPGQSSGQIHALRLIP